MLAGLSPATLPKHVDLLGKLALTGKIATSILPASYCMHGGQAGFGCLANLVAGHWVPGECIPHAELAWCRQVLTQTQLWLDVVEMQ